MPLKWLFAHTLTHCYSIVILYWHLLSSEQCQVAKAPDVSWLCSFNAKHRGIEGTAHSSQLFFFIYFAICNPERFAHFTNISHSTPKTNITMAIQITRAIKLLSLVGCYANDMVYVLHFVQTLSIVWHVDNVLSMSDEF